MQHSNRPDTATAATAAADAAEQSASCLFNVTVTVPIPRLTVTRFLAFGDSMTAGEVSVPASGSGGSNFKLIYVPSESYPTHLTTLLKARYTTQGSSIEVRNFGLHGEWAQDGMRRLPGVLASNRPEVVLLMEGIYPALLTDLKRYIGVDGLHPTEEGYLRMAEVFRDAIRTNLEIR